MDLQTSKIMTQLLSHIGKIKSSQLVFPMSSIEYPGTRVIGHFFNYSSTRVLRSSIKYL